VKVGFLIDDSLDFPDGVQVYVLNVGSWLSSQGHEVHYLTSTTKRDDIPNVHSLTKNIQIPFNKNVLRVPLPVKKSKIRKLFANEQFDVIHVQMPYSPFFAGRVITQLPSSTAVVGTFHVAPYSKLETYSSMLLRPLYWRSIKRFDQIASVSESAQAFAKQAFGINSIVIPNAVPIKQFKQEPVAKKPSKVIDIRFLGRLVQRKGCHYLLRAMWQLKSKYPETVIHLTIAGQGPEEHKLKRLAQKLKIEDRVTFYGAIDRKDIPRYLADADILTFPSTGGESFGIILVEAMAAGESLVLAGDNPGYRKVVDDARVLFNPRDTNEFVELIIKFACDENLRRSVVKQQQRRAEEFDVRVVGQKIEAWYKEILAVSP
jgi:phosphatidyl-myo-inositol alpha-mannosyltransferase